MKWKKKTKHISWIREGVAITLTAQSLQDMKTTTSTVNVGYLVLFSKMKCKHATWPWSISSTSVCKQAKIKQHIHMSTLFNVSLMARTVDPVHVLYCDIADNSQSKYGSAFLVLEVLLHYRGPLEKLPTSLMLNSKQNWHLLTTIEWHHSKRLSSAA